MHVCANLIHNNLLQPSNNHEKVIYADIGPSSQGQNCLRVLPVEYSFHDNVQYSEVKHVRQSVEYLDSKGSLSW